MLFVTKTAESSVALRVETQRIDLSRLVSGVILKKAEISASVLSAVNTLAHNDRCK